MVPERVAYGIGRLLGALAYLVDRGHRRTALANLDLVFGREMTAQQRRRLVRRMFRHMGYTAVEFWRIPKLHRDMFDRCVTVEGLDHVDAAIERGKGVLFISGHIGTWEFLGPLVTLLGLPLSIVVRPLRTPEVDDIIESYRRCHGTVIIERARAALPIMRHLARGGGVGILVDQRAHREGVMMDFMGHPASVTTVPAEIAVRSGAAVIPAFALRDRPGHTTLVFEPELELERTGDTESDLIENTRRFQNVVERYIRMYPEQWLWLYRRWKCPKPRHLRGYHRNLRQNSTEPTETAVQSTVGS